MTRRFFLTSILCLVFSIFLTDLKFSSYPGEVKKYISLRIRMDRGGPEEIEQDITAPMEKELLKMRGVDEISSFSSRGESRVTVLLDEDTDIDAAYLEMRERIDGLSREIPESAGNPLLIKSGSVSNPVFIMALNEETESLSEDRLKSMFRTINGVGEVEISSAPPREIHIEGPAGLLNTLKLGSVNLASQISAFNSLTEIPLPRHSPLIMDQRLKSAADFSQIPLEDGTRVGDLCRVRVTNAEGSQLSRVNGRESPVILIRSTSDANIIELCRELRKRSALFPGSTVLYDRGTLLEKILGELFRTLLVSCAAVALISGIYIRCCRSLILLCFNIPFSLAGTMALLRAGGQEINLTVIAGLAVCTGMIVDNGVIVMDRGFKESMKPLAASLLSTLLVLAPFLFASPGLKTVCTPVAVTVTLCLSLSFLFIMITGTSLDGGISGGGSNRKNHKRKYRRYRRIPLDSSDFPGAGFPCTKNRMIKRKGFPAAFAALMILAVTAVHSLGGLRYSQDLSIKDKTLGFTIEFEAGRTREWITEQLQELEEQLSTLNKAEYYSSTYRDEKGIFLIRLQKESDREWVREWVLEKARLLPGYLSFDDALPEQSYLIKVLGEDTEILLLTADSLAERLSASDGMYQVVLGYKEQPAGIRIITDNQSSSASGISPGDTAGFIALSQSPPVLGKWLPGNGEVLDIRIETAANQTDLGNRVIPSSGEYRLHQLAEITESEMTGGISRYNGRRERSIMLTGFTEKPSEIRNMVNRSLETFPLPVGIRILHGKKLEDRSRQIRELIKLMAAALVLLLLLLIFFFENFCLSLLLFAGIALTELFILSVLALSGTALSVPLFFALILSAGLNVNNGLLVFSGFSGRLPSREEAWMALDSCRVSLLSAAGTTLAGIIPFLFFGKSSLSLFRDLSLTLGLGILISLLLLPLLITLLPVDQRRR